MSRDGLAALPRGATGLSTVCDCGILTYYFAQVADSFTYRSVTPWTYFDWLAMVSSLECGKYTALWIIMNGEVFINAILVFEYSVNYPS